VSGRGVGNSKGQLPRTPSRAGRGSLKPSDGAIQHTSPHPWQRSVCLLGVVPEGLGRQHRHVAH
jgi:hypothetical protein